jgi:hypothetical protein
VLSLTLAGSTTFFFPNELREDDGSNLDNVSMCLGFGGIFAFTTTRCAFLVSKSRFEVFCNIRLISALSRVDVFKSMEDASGLGWLRKTNSLFFLLSVVPSFFSGESPITVLYPLLAAFREEVMFCA